MPTPAKPRLEGRTVRRRDSQAIFARIVAADFSCPRCDWTTRLRSQGASGAGRLAKGKARVKVKHDRVWDPRLARFNCGGCGLVLHLGIVAWPTVEKARGGTPPDTVPTYRQALSLRRELSRLAEEARRGGDGVNALGEEEDGAAAAGRWIWERQRAAKEALEQLEAQREDEELERWRAAEAEARED